MKNIGLFSIVIVMLASSSCHQSDPVEKTFQLVWSDEFEGNELDESKWEIQTGNGSQYGLWNWGNEEEQWYQEENITLINGKLVIQAKAENVEGYQYTSARIRSLNKADFKYGKIEASIKMDDTNGLWHAFWMLPSSEDASWPLTGEIDIMEYVGNQSTQVYNTIHFADINGTHSYIGEQQPFSQGDEFHLYAVEWNESSITWFIDDIETFSIDISDERISETWPFTEKFHLLLNTAVGGQLGGSVDASALQFPKFLEVEYVRVYQEV